ncbi:MAG: hypothetical protein DMF87_24575 [Acidobacteria bacterium]|nr:MAG: hypothetical protein DMF88_13630 [Acidobacteriota bacterium]PYR73869.1 MAG: hypothetical protein DMF87_24575 [Acidobacteriota bacterium]
MKSTASFKSHPIHPMLIPFPFVFLSGGWGFRVAAAMTGNDELKTVSRYLVPAGLVAGLVAAVPGAIDYLGSVPPQSSAKERATKHALLNVASLALFAAGWLAGRRRGGNALPIALHGAGTATLCAAGWMGGTLAYRNQIGVDHRYASAGTWQEERVDGEKVAALDDAAHGLEMNQMKLVHVDGKRVAVGRTGKGYAAFQDRCTHRGGPLSDGALMCGTVQCPWHGSQFDVHTGEVKAGPAEEKIETYDVAISHGARHRHGSSRR